MEFGGGYTYVDAYKRENLDELVNRVTAHMRQHRIKVLGLFNSDTTIESEAVFEGYKAFIEANDWLEAIVVCAYFPYNAGHGKILWYKNSKGIDIPVISVGYHICQGANNVDGQGIPSYVASEIIKDNLDFSLVEVNAWSAFTDTGSPNYWEQEAVYGPVTNAGAADLCQRSVEALNINKDVVYKHVGLQEFVWRLRMKHNR